MQNPRQIIDISQAVSSQTACFPGDIPFSREITMRYDQSGVINLCAFTMSPHVGTHADAPVHIHGDLQQPVHQTETIGQVGLAAYVGPVAVVDVSPCAGPIEWRAVQDQLMTLPAFPERLLFKTRTENRPEVFENDYAFFSVELVRECAQRNVKLIGLDTPSVDPVDSKTLPAHHALLQAGIVWLENLDLSAVPLTPQQPELYFLSALPLKFMQLEASPVRAVLMRF